MPLPANDILWPPRDSADLITDQTVWAAWWAGDTVSLTGDALANTAATTPRARFWQRRRDRAQERATQALHVPLAADIASVSADLLFGEPPDLRIPDRKGQERLAELVELACLPNILAEGGEVCAAMGGVYLRAVWDTEVADHPLVTAVPPDQAVIPEFRFGRLYAVTFAEEVYRDSSQTWRHVERHEPGQILHGLYVGSETNLGGRVPLGEHPTTAALAEEITLPDGMPPLCVRYVPNVLPNRSRRYSPQGRSDYAGAEPMMDSLDETYTSWMRDLRLGQARILARDGVLTPPRGRGQGRALDVDQELFLTHYGTEEEGDPFTEVQFKIRVAEHAQTAAELVERIVSTAGYSPQTFGLRIDGRAESGTALRIREAKTYRTQSRKQRYWQPAVVGIAETLLAIDRTVFGRPTVVDRPTLRWPDATADDPQAVATTVDMLRRAQVMSVWSGVRMAQPHLDDDQVRDEVDRIMAEQGMSVADPTSRPPTGDPADDGLPVDQG